MIDSVHREGRACWGWGSRADEAKSKFDALRIQNVENP